MKKEIDKKKLSIIIPHYNSLKKLERLIKTIPYKNKDVEVIVVDDNSEDKIGYELLKEKYKEIIFLKNISSIKGAGASRNIGLQNSKGEWLLFADADDFFLENAFEKIERYLNNKEDIIFFTPTSMYEDTKKKAERHLMYKNLVEKYLIKGNIGIRYFYMVPWSKLIKRNLVEKKNIKFDEVIASNDINFSLKIGFYANSIKGTRDQIYCVTKNKGSLTTSVSKEIFDSRYEAVKRYNDFLKEKKLTIYQSPMIDFIFMSRRYGYKEMLKVLLESLSKNYIIIPRSYYRIIKNPKLLIEKIISKRKEMIVEKKYQKIR